ncbi:MAG: HAMP domain-containing histidine kinase [Oscillospiraceae bacterium]|jgi:signal transduction histidine kinase|nr:HAMP domain-containing histidine kinase [Oscillospiraceae bacterium]
MISQHLKTAITLSDGNNHNAVVLINSEYQILWMNKRYSEIFKKKRQTTIHLPGESFFLDGMQDKSTKTIICGIPATTIEYTVKVFKIQSDHKTYYKLEFIVSSDVADVIKYNDTSHILRTFSFSYRSPISRIFNITETLGEQWGGRRRTKKSDVDKNLKEINNNCLRLLRNLENCADVVKYSLGMHELELVLVDIQEFIESIVFRCSKFVQKNGLTIEFSANFSHERTFVCLDDNKIELALANIIVNSCTFSPNAGQITVSVEVDIHKRTFQVCVKDCGAGMDAETLSKATIAYCTGNSGDQPYSQGLGLTIAKYIAELHHGKLCIDSIIGVGTTVVLQLPFNIQKKDVSVLRSPTLKECSDKYSVFNIQFS